MDVSLRSRAGWMAVGALTCLVGLAALVRLYGPNQARAQADLPPAKCEKPAAPAPLPPLGTSLPNLVPPPPAPVPEIIPARAEVPAVPPPGLPGGETPPPPPAGSEAKPIIIPGSVQPSSPTPPPVPDTPPTPYEPPTKSPPPVPEVPVVRPESDVTPLPALRARPSSRPRSVLPLTGTYPAKVDATGKMVLPPQVMEQLGHCETVLLSPGSDRCLWLTNQAHLDRLGQKLDKSPARESDVRGFKRLYFAQVVKVPLKDSSAEVASRLSRFAGLSSDVVLVGIDDHFEVWDAARWRKYTQAKKAGE